MDSDEICHQMGKTTRYLCCQVSSPSAKGQGGSVSHKKGYLTKRSTQSQAHKWAHHDKTMISSPPFLPLPSLQPRMSTRQRRPLKCSVLSFSRIIQRWQFARCHTDSSLICRLARSLARKSQTLAAAHFFPFLILILRRPHGCSPSRRRLPQKAKTPSFLSCRFTKDFPSPYAIAVV